MGRAEQQALEDLFRLIADQDQWRYSDEREPVYKQVDNHLDKFPETIDQIRALITSFVQGVGMTEEQISQLHLLEMTLPYTKRAKKIDAVYEEQVERRYGKFIDDEMQKNGVNRIYRADIIAHLIATLKNGMRAEGAYRQTPEQIESLIVKTVKKMPQEMPVDKLRH